MSYKNFLGYEKDKEGNIVINERDWVKTEISNLYSCLKKQDSYIKFAFLTGVTKFN